MKLSQTDHVLEHLMAGRTITPLEALGLYGIFRLGSIIHRLRKRGYPIVTTLKYTITSKPYGEYRLLDKKVDA